MKTSLRSLLLLVALILSGCLPEERFWWSPDGSRAVVAAGGRLYLATADGDLNDSLSDELRSNDDMPRHIAWLPDGSGFVLHRVQRLSDWNAARALLPAEEINEIERRALGIPGLLNAGAAMANDADAIEALLAVVSVREKELMSAAFFCAWQKQTAAVEAAVRAGKKGGEILTSLREDTAPFRIHELCLVTLRDDHPEGTLKSIVRSVRPVVLPAMSPKFPVLAFWRIMDEDKRVALEVCTLDGQSKLSVATSTSVTFDWTPDGRSLVFAAPIGEGDSLFQNIRRVTVLQESGALIGENLQVVDLAVGILPSSSRVCALPDGRVLFASQPATLPAPTSGMDLAPHLYVISADERSVNVVPTAPGDLPANLGFFVPSPDGKRVAVVESDTDAVAVVDLSTGRTDIVSPAHPRWGSRTMPAWKSATELTFAALEGPTGGPKWMYWSSSAGVRSISKTWPPDATREWLNEKKDDSKSGQP